jgi:hypothetical protein
MQVMERTPEPADLLRPPEAALCEPRPRPAAEAVPGGHRRRDFIIHSVRFDDNAGGAIALHRLCDLLNRVGERAWLWDSRRPMWNPERPLSSAWHRAHYRLSGRERRYRVGPGFTTPLADEARLREAIVVYPEVVDGNPLYAERVVRWLLHRPGHHTGRVNFGRDDRYFYYQKAFDDPRLNPDPGNLLRVMFVLDDIYRQSNFGPRSGTCYILRKGRGRTLVHDSAESLLVDDLSHRQLAEVFNRVEACISYDTYTMYSLYAALCGCLSIVVPEDGVSKEQWYPDPADRHGLAYGFDDLEHARATRHLLLPRIKAQEHEANASVLEFVTKCRAYFP